jgi:hypothetical protein
MAAIVYKVHELRIQSRWKMGAFVAREKDWTLFSGIRDVQSKLSTAPKKKLFSHFLRNVVPSPGLCAFQNYITTSGMPDFSWYNIPKRGKYTK